LAISGLRCSLALRLFFIAQPKPVQKPPDGGSVDFDAALGKFNAQLVQSHFAMDRHAFADPLTMGRKLAARRMALLGGRKTTGRPLQDHHVVDEAGRNAEMPRSLPMTVALIYKRNDTLTQLNRMRLAHGASPSMGRVNHRSPQTGTLNPVSCDTL
jgi:hypothetical protein